VHVGARATGEAFEEIRYQFGLKITDPYRVYSGLDDGCNAAAKIYGSQTESLVHRHHEIAGSQDSAFAAQSLVKSFAKCNAYIFNCVVLIYVEITARLEFEIETTVPGKRLQHVI
jgi:hypothetical protein